MALGLQVTSLWRHRGVLHMCQGWARGGAVPLDVTQAFGSSSCPLSICTGPEEWADFLINQSQFHFLKLKFHRSSAFPVAHCPRRGWENNWNHMSQFD